MFALRTSVYVIHYEVRSAFVTKIWKDIFKLQKKIKDDFSFYNYSIKLWSTQELKCMLLLYSTVLYDFINLQKG